MLTLPTSLIAPSNSPLDDLFAAKEDHGPGHREGPEDVAFEACQNGRLPPGGLAHLVCEGAARHERRAALSDGLEEVLSHFTRQKQHRAGMAAHICLRASELGPELRQDPWRDASHARPLLKAAATLSRCLDAQAPWRLIQLQLQEDSPQYRHEALRRRLARIEEMSTVIDRELADPGIDPAHPGPLSSEVLEALTRRTEAVAERMGALLAAARNLLSLADLRGQRVAPLLAALSDYEDIVAKASERATCHGASNAIAMRIAGYDGLGPEVLRMPGQMSVLRDALLGRGWRE